MARGQMTRTKAWLCIAMSTLLIAVSLVSISHHLRVLSYAATTGKVTARTIEAKHGKGTSYAPVVTYSYAVNGTMCVNNDVFVGKPAGTQSWANGVISQFPVASQCTVYYDASNPDRSVLLRFPGGPSLALMIGVPALAGLFLFVCIAWLVKTRTVHPNSTLEVAEEVARKL